MNLLRACGRLVTILLLGATSSVFSLRAQEAADVATIARNASRSVVTIRAFDSQGNELRLGSGFFLPDGRLVTNQHVVSGGAWVEVLDADGSLIGTASHAEALSSRLDLAVLPRLGSPPSGLVLTRSTPQQGEPVVVIGSPEGLGNSVSEGIVSAIRTRNDRRLIQLTAPVSQGSSGGPVLNRHGEVIGVTVSMFSSGQNLNFAVPADVLDALINSPPAQLAFGAAQNDSREALGNQSPSATEYSDIRIGDVLTGNLTASDYSLDDGSRADFYYYTGTAGQAVRIQMISDAVDSYVILMATEADSLFRVGENDDGPDGLDADLKVVLPIDGLYAIVASTYEGEEFGSYTLSLSDDASTRPPSVSGSSDTALTIVLVEISDVIQEAGAGDETFRGYLRRSLQDLDVVVLDELPQGATRPGCSLELVARTMAVGHGSYDVAIAPVLVFDVDGEVNRSRPAGIIMYHGYENLNAAARATAENVISSLKPLCDFTR